MVQLEDLVLSIALLDEANIEVCGAEVEQFPHLEVLKFSTIQAEGQLGVMSLIDLGLSIDLVQIGLGWVALWEVGLA